MGKLGLEARMTITELARRGFSRCAIARTLDVTEGTIRYHLSRQASEAIDGRSSRPRLAARWDESIRFWLQAAGVEGPVNLAALHEWLVGEHAYAGSLRSVQRYVASHFPAPKLRARRRVETVPGAQAQADWAHWPEVLIDGQRRSLLTFHLKLSHSRREAVVWSERKDQLCWLKAHNESFRRLEGIPATVRVDNEKTAVSRGAGAWGELNATYQRYAQTVRFHIDACPPRSPRNKGKVERAIRSARLWSDPRRRHWGSLEELQRWTDEASERSARTRTCPATGTSVWEAWRAEKRHLTAVHVLPEPFDVVVTRTVAPDCMVAFESRSYSVPFRLIGKRVEVRGCAGTVQFLHGATIVASHRRHTAERILIDPKHYEGPSTVEIEAPLPLGRMGRRLAEIAAMEPQRRPVDLYAALVEVAR